MKDFKETLDKHLKQCYEIHNVQIPDKYIPYLLEFAKEIRNNTIDECIENAEVEDYYPNNYTSESYKRINPESLLKLKV